VQGSRSRGTAQPGAVTAAVGPTVQRLPLRFSLIRYWYKTDRSYRAQTDRTGKDRTDTTTLRLGCGSGVRGRGLISRGTAQPGAVTAAVAVRFRGWGLGVRVSSHIMYSFISFRKSPPPQNGQDIKLTKYSVDGFVGELTL